MMLQALIAYSEREGFGNDPDIRKLPVRWVIPIDNNGHITGPLIELVEDAGAKKPKPQQRLRPFTRTDDIGHGRAHFLCDIPERALGMFEAVGSDKAKTRAAQFQFFVGLLRKASAACPTISNRLNAVVQSLEDKHLLGAIHKAVTEAKVKANDSVSFSVDGELLLDMASLRDFWRGYRKATGEAQQTTTRKGSQSAKRLTLCLATGELKKPVRTAGKVRGVPNTQGSGANLIAFDKASFTSFGLEKALNASISAEADLKVCAALEELVKKGVFIPQFVKPQHKDKQSVHLHWSRQPMQLDPLDPLVSGDPQAVERLLSSVQRGQQVVGLDTNAYYCLSLSGNGARIVVRDWLESTVADVSRNVAGWFQALAIVEPEGVSVKHDFKLAALLYGMVRAELDELPPQIPTQLLHAALRGTPLPQSALAAALRRQQVEQKKPGDKFDPKLNPARLALIKACLLRSPNLSTPNHQPTTPPMTECLNPDSRDPAYLCGRLFAVFDRLQYLALGGVNAGVVERYYASASTTPALVMGRLFRNAQFHLAKTEGGVATNVAKDFEAITCALGDQFPASLDLEGQGRFALGYYQQKADYRRRTAERKDAEAKAAVAG
jgi:CRISPR-associated protein Csd1